MGVNTKEEALQQVIEKYGDVGKTDVQKIESDSLVFFTITPVPESGNPNDSDIIYLVQQDGRIYKRTKSETNDEIHPANKEERELQAEEASKIYEVIERKTDLQRTHAQVSQLKDEPDYWLVAEVSLESEDIVGGTAYVVNKYEDVAQVSSGESPRERLQEAKDYFEQQGLTAEHAIHGMNNDEALHIVRKYYGDLFAQVSQIEEEPEYWLVTPQSKNGEPLVGGVAYVVTSHALVFETSASIPPHARVQAAKEYFKKLKNQKED